MPNWKNPQSGVAVTDFYREAKGKEAANILSVGDGIRCVVGDHTGSELCVEVIARLKNETTKKGRNTAETADAIKAINNLRAGNGFHKVAADHAGGNTCSQVIGAATT